MHALRKGSSLRTEDTATCAKSFWAKVSSAGRNQKLPKCFRQMADRRWLVSVLGVCAACAAGPSRPTESCAPVGKPQVLADVPEASGITAGRSLWMINDFGKSAIALRTRFGRRVLACDR